MKLHFKMFMLGDFCFFFRNTEDFLFQDIIYAFVVKLWLKDCTYYTAYKLHFNSQTKEEFMSTLEPSHYISRVLYPSI